MRSRSRSDGEQHVIWMVSATGTACLLFRPLNATMTHTLYLLPYVCVAYPPQAFPKVLCKHPGTKKGAQRNVTRMMTEIICAYKPHRLRAENALNPLTSCCWHTSRRFSILFTKFPGHRSWFVSQNHHGEGERLPTVRRCSPPRAISCRWPPTKIDAGSLQVKTR